MIVLWIAVVMLVDGSATEDHFVQQPRINHFGESAVNRRAANLSNIGICFQIGEQLVRIEMLVPTGNLLDDDSPLLRDSHSLGLQILLEPLER
jgi:hypothetical protein